MWLCVREEWKISLVQKSYEGLDLAQVGAWRGATPGAEESSGLRSRDLDSGSSPSAHQLCDTGPVTLPLGNSVCPYGKWVAGLFKIFPYFFFFFNFSVLGRSWSRQTWGWGGCLAVALGLSSNRHGLMWGLSSPAQG